MEKLREDYDSQQVTLSELRHQLCRRQEHLASQDAQLVALTAQVEQLQQERVVLDNQRKGALAENVALRETCTHQEGVAAGFGEQLERSVLLLSRYCWQY